MTTQHKATVHKLRTKVAFARTKLAGQSTTILQTPQASRLVWELRKLQLTSK